MSASHIVRFSSMAALAFLVGAFGATNVFAQWSFRASSQPIIRNINVLANTPVAGTNTLIVSTQTDGMVKGTETASGTTWQKIGNGIPVVQVRAHVVSTSTIFYAATLGAGVYKTSNGGTNWSAINGSGATALGCLDIRSIAVTAVVGSTRTLLAATSCRNNSGVFRGTDDGVNPVSWTRLGPAAGLPGSLPADIQASAVTRIGSGATTIFFLATFNYGIFRSGDDGANWASANNGISGSNAFNVSFSGSTSTDSNNVLAYIHGTGIYRSTDSGANWVASNTGLPGNFAALGGINRDATTTAALAQTLYIGLDKAGVYRTTDGGLNWALWGGTAADESAKYARGVTGTVTAGTYYLATLNGIVKTSDNGATLQSVGDMPGGRINAITHDRDNARIAYVTITFPIRINDIYGDYDNNATTTLIETGITGATHEGVVYQDRLTPTTLYVVTNNRGIFKSTNSGTSFAQINSGLPNMIGQVTRLAIDPTNSQILYLGLSDVGGVYKSINGGTSWTLSSTGLSSPLGMAVGQITIDGNNPAIVWAPTDAGLYKSINAGANWTLMYSAVDAAGSALPAGIVRVRLGNSNEIYLATNHANANGSLAASSGIQKSIDGGLTWNNILPGQRGSQVRVTTGGDIYAGVSAEIGNPAVYLSTNGGTSFAPYATNLQGSDIRSFGFAANESALLSLSLENGFYTNDAAAPQTVVNLTVNRVGTGFVTSSPGGINCGSICVASVAPGSMLTLTATGQTGSTFAGWSGGGCAGTGTCVVTVNTATTVTATFTGGPVSLTAVLSRKTHGAAGVFDVAIDSSVAIAGAVTVDPRIIGSGHTIVFQFNVPVSSVDAVSSTVGAATAVPVGNDVVVTLANVPDNRRTRIALTNVNGGGTNVEASMGFLVGDVNNTRSVTASDISGVKARSGQTTSALNFKFDVNATGAINASDISAVKARSGLTLPP